MDKKTKDISQFISLVLRHKPEAAGLTLDEHGWADVDDMIKGINAAMGCSLDCEALEEIVRTDEKQRYSFNEDGTLIRANQGHSIPVDVELEEKTPPDILYHGTGEKYFRSINEQGLLPKSRLYVHLTSDNSTAVRVGERHGNPVTYGIDCRRMAEDGYKFYLSKNGVWLTEKVPKEYLHQPILRHKYTMQEMFASSVNNSLFAQEDAIAVYAHAEKESRENIDNIFSLLTGTSFVNTAAKYYAQYRGFVVKHRKLGKGELWQVSNTGVKIKFGEKLKEYPFPDAFVDGTLTIFPF